MSVALPTVKRQTDALGESDASVEADTGAPGDGNDT
jgi:hypothetical protein